LSEITLERLGSHFGRELLLAHVASLSEAATAVSAVDGQSILFVVVDAGALAEDELEDFARRSLNAGAAYVCACGPGCDRVHLAFDLAFIDDQERFAALSGWSETDTVMTSEHDNLEEGLFFAVWCAFPTEAFDQNCPVLAIVVGNAELAETVRLRLREPERLPDLVE
jgi:hypothetical protein